PRRATRSVTSIGAGVCAAHAAATSTARTRTRASYARTPIDARARKLERAREVAARRLRPELVREILGELLGGNVRGPGAWVVPQGPRRRRARRVLDDRQRALEAVEHRGDREPARARRLRERTTPARRQPSRRFARDICGRRLVEHARHARRQRE